MYIAPSACVTVNLEFELRWGEGGGVRIRIGFDKPTVLES